MAKQLNGWRSNEPPDRIQKQRQRPDITEHGPAVETVEFCRVRHIITERCFYPTESRITHRSTSNYGTGGQSIMSTFLRDIKIQR